jgi:hypothetical protein
MMLMPMDWHCYSPKDFPTLMLMAMSLRKRSEMSLHSHLVKLIQMMKVKQIHLMMDLRSQKH